MPGDAGQCHLMVQVMEAWLVADLDVLQDYYGQGFRANHIPKHDDIEAVPKDNVLAGLRAATAHTQKGAYRKIRHGADLLAKITPAKVRERAPHCERLFNALSEALAKP